jgi:hypothetical protein
MPRITDYQAELIDMGDSDALELAVQEILRNMGLSEPPGRSNSASAASSRQIAVSQGAVEGANDRHSERSLLGLDTRNA